MPFDAADLPFRNTNAYLVSAVDSVRDACALFDEHHRVIMVNSAARQLLGAGGFDFSTEELLAPPAR